MIKEIIYITGDRDSGKTTAALALAEKLAADSVSAGGFLSLAALRGGEKNAYYVFHLVTKEARILASTVPLTDYVRWDRFFFSKAGLDFAAQSCLTSLEKEVLFLDEIGLFEIKGSGFYRLLNTLLNEYSGTIVLLVRKSRLAAVKQTFSLGQIPSRIITPAPKEDIYAAYLGI